MNRDELVNKLTHDLKSLNIPVNEVDIDIRPFSSTYFGRYYPSFNEDKCKPRLFIYPYSDESGNMYPYDEVLSIAIHEMVHHIQYSDKSFVRLKGIMHDTNFWKLYNRYINKATQKGMMGGEVLEKSYS